MKNPFLKYSKKKKNIIHILPSYNINANNTISGSINNIPSLTTINISSGMTYSMGTISDEMMKWRKEQLMDEFEQNPELFSEIIVELRQRKIRQLKEKSTPQS